MASKVVATDSSVVNLETVGSLLPGLPGETALAYLGSSLLEVLPDGAREFVRKNMSVRAPNPVPNGDIAMASLPRIAGPALGAAKKTAQTGAKLVGAGLTGLTLLTVAQNQFPETAQAVADYLAKSGKDVNSLAQDKSPVIQGTLVELLARLGLPVDVIEASGLSSQELRQYRSILDKYRKAANRMVDTRQVRSESSGSPELDRIATNLDIQRICDALNVTSETYAVILRGINSHTSDDVEAFQLHRQLYGMRVI
jgi:hypothetical protein